MVSYKPVSVSKASFFFCRFSMAIMVWLSYLIRSKVILGIVWFIFLMSAILKVKRAPMIRFFDVTFNQLIRSSEVLVNEKSIFFAHVVGFVMAFACLIFVCTVSSEAVWYGVLVFSLLKTVSAFGFCPASKLYDCTVNGNCCVKKDRYDANAGC